MRRTISGLVVAALLTLAVAAPAGATATIGGGNAVTSRAYLDSYSNFVIVDKNNPISASGELTSWSFWAGATSGVQLVVVRVAGGVATVVGESPTVTSATTGEVVTTALSPAIPVQAGDYVGLYFVSTGVVPFDGIPSSGTSGTVLYTMNDYGDPTVGATLTFEGAVDRIYSVSVSGTIPTATIQLIKQVLPADDSLWNFVITNGKDKIYQTYSDQSAPFDSGVLTIDNPTAFEIDEWAGTGTDIADYTASVACTDNGSALTPTASTYYDVGSQTRFYVYFIPALPGHDYVCTFTNTNLYDFTGFFAPVDNLPTLNVVKAGQAIPVKFSLGGDNGLDIFWSGYPKSTKIACETGANQDFIEATVTAGGSSLSYDSLTDTYNYVWKTDKAWSGTCRQLEVRLADGTFHYANFKFK